MKAAFDCISCLNEYPCIKAWEAYLNDQVVMMTRSMMSAKLPYMTPAAGLEAVHLLLCDLRWPATTLRSSHASAAEIKAEDFNCTGSGDAGDTVSVANPRLLIHLGARASCQVVEEFAAPAGEPQVFTNAVAEILLEEAAMLRHGYALLTSKEPAIWWLIAIRLGLNSCQSMADT